MRDYTWERRASIIFCVGAGVLCGWFVFKYLLWAVLPFIIGWFVALLVTPVSKWISAKTKLPRKLCAAVVVVAVLAGLVFVTTLLIDRLTYELSRLLDVLKDTGISLDIDSMVSGMVDRFPMLGKIFDGKSEQLTDMLMQVISNSLSSLGKLVPSTVFSAVSRLPSIILSLMVTILACFYFSLDLDAIHAAVAVLLPEKWREGWNGAKQRFFGVIAKWMRAYFILFLITFGALLIGFMILRVDYALLIALIGALVDILPVVGVGIIFVPWGIGALIGGNAFLGAGLFIMYGAISILRQLVEPHIVGGSIGVHPLLTLVAMFVGFRLFGIAGMIILPGVLGVVGGMVRQEQK